MTTSNDLEMKGGRVVPRQTQTSPADTREQLPQVPSTDRLGSDKWGESLKKQAGEMGNDPVLDQVKRAHTTMVQGMQRLAEVRKNQSPNQTQAQHLNQLNTDYERFTKSAAQANDHARERIKSRINEIDAEFRTRADFKDRGNGSEIRSVLRGMKDADRQEFIDKAVHEGDGEALAAILDAHPSLSGMSKEHHKAIRQRALQVAAPELYQLEKTLHKADELLFDSFTDVLDAGDKLTAKEVRMKMAERERKAAEARTNAQQAWEGSI